MFAWAVAILRDKYREIGHLMGECNREIDPIRASVHREFPINTSKRASERVFGPFFACFACQKAFSLALCAGVRCQVSGVKKPGDQGTEGLGNRVSVSGQCALISDP
jgi:hypothetical protein